MTEGCHFLRLILASARTFYTLGIINDQPKRDHGDSEFSQGEGAGAGCQAH